MNADVVQYICDLISLAYFDVFCVRWNSLIRALYMHIIIIMPCSVLIILKMERTHTHIILWGRFLKYRNAAVKNELLRRTEDKLRARAAASGGRWCCQKII
jgi:hypothetical protein